MNVNIKLIIMKLKEIISFIMLLGVGIIDIHAQATLRINDFAIEPGESKTISIDMENSVPISGFQVQVVFPQGLSMSSRPTIVEERQGGSYVDPEFGEVQCVKSLSYAKQEDGSYIITVFDDHAVPFSGTEGAVVTFKVKAAADAPNGKVAITLQNMELVYEDGVTILRPENTTCQVTIGHLHTPDADGVCTSCDEAVQLVINDSESADFNPDYTVYANLTYNRTIAAGKFGTIVLPFTPDLASLTNYSFYKLAEATENLLIFREETTPEAGVPYLYRLKTSATESAPITGTKVSVVSEALSVTVGDWTMTGSFVNRVVDCKADAETNYYAYNSANNEINRATNTLTIKPYRAYITSPVANGAKQMRIIINNETTGINDIYDVDMTNVDEGIYDLCGRSVANPQKGLYIKNGKKVIIK